MILLLAIVTTTAGNLCLYLTSPNQRWLGKPLNRVVGLGSATLLCILGLWAWLHSFSPAAGLFSFLVLSMLLLGLYPYLSLVKPAAGRP